MEENKMVDFEDFKDEVEVEVTNDEIANSENGEIVDSDEIDCDESVISKRAMRGFAIGAAGIIGATIFVIFSDKAKSKYLDIRINMSEKKIDKEKQKQLKWKVKKSGLLIEENLEVEKEEKKDE